MSNRIGYINRDFEFPVYQQNSDGTPVAALSTDRFTYTVRQGTATPVISLTGLAYADLATARIDIVVAAAAVVFEPGYYTEELIRTDSGADVVYRAGVHFFAEGHASDIVASSVIVRGTSVILRAAGPVTALQGRRHVAILQ